MTDGDLLPAGTEIDLDNCAREPIHIPGSIQPRGVLLVAEEPGLTVTQVSANVAELLGPAPDEVLGAPLARAVGAPAADRIARATAGFGDLRERNPLELTIEVAGRAVPFDGILHREEGGVLFVELEVATGPRPFSFPNTYLAVRGAIGELNRAVSIDGLYRITARVVRELTGFDRVMVYRYDADYNGEVVAEDRRAELNSFLGLHYPASDIPAQARALYEKNWIRLISDVGYVPSPLVPELNPTTGRPTDLTHSTLRSVSPIHLEYLRTMGVGASMSISLLRDGRLWGLIACHHYSGPHLPPYGTRTAAEFLGSALSLRLVGRAEDEELRTRLAGQALLNDISAAVQNSAEPLDVSLFAGPALTELVPADGVAVLLNGRIATRGRTPGGRQLEELTRWLVERDEPMVATDCLRRSAPALDIDPAQASGVLAVVLRDGQYLIWFRGEAERSVDWGGDPHNKAIARREGNEVRLSPRRSFERWREVVRDRSLPWTAEERADAAALRQSLVELLYARVEREIRLAETLQRSLLPELPAVPGWEVSAHYEPAAGGRIGGDWYDAFRVDADTLVVVLGDVAGHGIAAAGTMAQLRNALRAYLVAGRSPVDALAELNRFARRLLPDAFATVAVAVIEVGTGRALVVNAGHPVPLLIGAGEPRQAPLPTSPPVGVPRARYTAAELELPPGSGLVLFSDGLVERRDEDLSAGLDRLVAATRTMLAGAAPVTAAAVTAAVQRGESADDITVLVLRHR